MTISTVIPKHVEEALSTHRRGFLKSAGLLVVSFATSGTTLVTEAVAQNSTAAQPGPYPDPDFRQLDSWIVIHQNNTVTFYVGKTDSGQGTGTGFRQLMSDELDIAFDQTTCIMGSTDITVNQGGSGGSSAMERDSWPMRRAAAEARRVLLEMASARLRAPVDQLAVSNAVIRMKADPSKRVTYGELIAGKKFNVTLTGANVNAVTGVAKVKPVQELKYTGQPLQRDDIPAKVDGSQKWAVDVKLPGMVHARNVKPPFACAKLTGIDESPVRNLPGFIKVVNKGNYVAVVCEREEQAIRAARELKAIMGEAGNRSLPSLGRSVPLHARRDAHFGLRSDRGGRSRCGIFGRGKGDRSRIRGSVPGTYRVCGGSCGRGPVERPDDGLFERHEVLQHEDRRCCVSRHAEGTGSGCLYAGPAVFRPKRGGGCGL